jgi:hypothetical protein
VAVAHHRGYLGGGGREVHDVLLAAALNIPVVAGTAEPAHRHAVEHV